MVFAHRHHDPLHCILSPLQCCDAAQSELWDGDVGLERIREQSRETEHMAWHFLSQVEELSG